MEFINVFTGTTSHINRRNARFNFDCEPRFVSEVKRFVDVNSSRGEIFQWRGMLLDRPLVKLKM